MFINFYKFIGEDEQNRYVEKQLKSFSDLTKPSFDDHFKTFEKLWVPHHDDLFNHLTDFLKNERLIDAVGNVLRIPKRIESGEYSMHSDTIIALLNKSIELDIPITTDTLSSAFQLSWENFSSLDEKLSNILGADFKRPNDESITAPIGPAGIYKSTPTEPVDSSESIDSSDYVMAHDYASFEFLILRNTLIHFGDEAKKLDTKKKQLKTETKKEEEKQLAVIRSQAIKREQELRQYQHKSTRTKDGG